MPCIEEQQRLKKLARRTPAEIEQDRRNEQAIADWKAKGRSEKPLPYCAFTTKGPKAARSEEAIEFFLRDPAERAKDPEPTEADLRRKVQDSHPDHGGNPDEFIAAKKALDRKRGRK